MVTDVLCRRANQESQAEPAVSSGWEAVSCQYPLATKDIMGADRP